MAPWPPHGPPVALDMILGMTLKYEVNNLASPPRILRVSAAAGPRNHVHYLQVNMSYVRISPVYPTSRVYMLLRYTNNPLY